MDDQSQIQSVGIVGGGLIGLSWASLFCAFGYDTTVYDPDPEVHHALPAFVDAALANLRELGYSKKGQTGRPGFTSVLQDLRDVDFIQECGPDRIAVKQDILSALEEIIRPDVIIASSTSSLLASDIQDGARHPDRILVAHPMNPPHMVPLVELVAGRRTDLAALDQAEALYRRLDRITVRVKKEVVGHLANRLTSALYREAVYIAAEGIADVEDIDRAIAYGPGMRWALMGPHLTYHLGGGKGGYRHYLDHLGPTQEARWREHGTAPLTEDLKDRLVAGVEQELSRLDSETLVQRRDGALAELLKLKGKWGF